MLLVACLSCPVFAAALEPGRAALASDHSSSLTYTGPRRMADHELRRAAAQGFNDPPQVQMERLFSDLSKYSANGNAVEVLGTLATLLNPPLAMVLKMIDAETSFRNVIYHPSNPATIVGWDGTVLLRLPSTIEELNFRHVRVSSRSGASFGDVEVRNIQLGGTRIIVKYRQ